MVLSYRDIERETRLLYQSLRDEGRTKNASRQLVLNAVNDAMEKAEVEIANGDWLVRYKDTEKYFVRTKDWGYVWVPSKEGATRWLNRGLALSEMELRGLSKIAEPIKGE